jgi:uncharacterized membrane protein
MISLHPPLSGLPFSFVLLLVGVECARLRGAWRDRLAPFVSPLIIVTVLSTICTFLSGYQASSSLTDLAPAVEAELGTHHAVGRLLMINAIIMVSFFRVSKTATHGRQLLRALYFLTLAIQFVLTIWVGYMGGELVFGRGLGVTIRP